MMNVKENRQRMVSLVILLLAMLMAWAADTEAGWFTVPEPDPEPVQDPVIIQPPPTSTDWQVLALHKDDVCAARYLGGNYICLCATRREMFAIPWNNLGPLSLSDFFVRHMPDVYRDINPIEQQACAELKEYF